MNAIYLQSSYKNYNGMPVVLYNNKLEISTFDNIKFIYVDINEEKISKYVQNRLKAKKCSIIDNTIQKYVLNKKMYKVEFISDENKIIFNLTKTVIKNINYFDYYDLTIPDNIVVTLDSSVFHQTISELNKYIYKDKITTNYMCIPQNISEIVNKDCNLLNQLLCQKKISLKTILNKCNNLEIFDNVKHLNTLFSLYLLAVRSIVHADFTNFVDKTIGLYCNDYGKDMFVTYFEDILDIDFATNERKYDEFGLIHSAYFELDTYRYNIKLESASENTHKFIVRDIITHKYLYEIAKLDGYELEDYDNLSLTTINKLDIICFVDTGNTIFFIKLYRTHYEILDQYDYKGRLYYLATIHKIIYFDPFGRFQYDTLTKSFYKTEKCTLKFSVNNNYIARLYEQIKLLL